MPDQRLFRAYADLSYRQEVEIEGEGTHELPWKMVVSRHPEIARKLPAIVAFKDDHHGVFQNNPLAPIDVAVIFSNLQRLGTRQLACSALLAWENPDPIGLTALEAQMAGFDSLVIAAPVTRGAIMEPLPEPFRRASLPIEEIGGSPAALPVVNRVSLPNLIYGGDRTLAGFQVIDSESESPHLPMLARWDYRIILSFPLLAVMQQLGLKPEDLEIHVGDSIRLGHNGPSIPIDEFGRLADPSQHRIWTDAIAAEKLIDATPAAFPKETVQRVLVADGRSHADTRLLEFNRTLPLAMASIAAGGEASTRTNYIRLGASQEIYALLVFTLLLGSMAPMPSLMRNAGYLAIAAGIVLGQYAAATFLHHWLPGEAAFTAVVIAAITSFGSTRTSTTKGVTLSEGQGLDFVRYSGQ